MDSQTCPASSVSCEPEPDCIRPSQPGSIDVQAWLLCCCCCTGGCCCAYCPCQHNKAPPAAPASPWFASIHQAPALGHVLETSRPDVGNHLDAQLKPKTSILSDQAEGGESMVQVMSPVSSEAEVPAEPAPAGRTGWGRPAERHKRQKGPPLPEPTGPEPLAGEAASPSQPSSPQ